MGTTVNSKNLVVHDLKINLQIWDFVGDEMFRPLLFNYARGAFGGLFIYDIANKESLSNIDSWFSLFQDKESNNQILIPIIFAGNKSDLASERKVNHEDALNASKSYNILEYFECSAKTNENIEILFITLTNEIMKRSNFL